MCSEHSPRDKFAIRPSSGQQPRKEYAYRYIPSCKLLNVLLFWFPHCVFVIINKNKEKKKECRMEKGRHFCWGSKSPTQEIYRNTARQGISALYFLLWLSKEIGRNAYIAGAMALPYLTDKSVIVYYLVLLQALCIRLRLGVMCYVSSACVTMKLQFVRF